MADVVQTVPFNFDELYTEIKRQFSSAGYDVSEGSNTSQLMTAEAYLISMLNANTALNVNETILPYATRRDNVVNDARNFGYEIQHKTSYVYNLTVSVTDGQKHIIPKYTKFECNGHTYYYFGKQIEINPETKQVITIQVKEGTLYTYEDDPEALTVTIGTTYENGQNVTQYYIDIPYTDVEEDGIECFCTYYDDYGIYFDKEPWIKASSTYLEVDQEDSKEFIRMDNIDYQTPRIYFKYAGVGRGLKLGTIVNLNVLTTSGADGSAGELSSAKFTCPDVIGLSVTGAELVSTGMNEESIKSIQENAPKLYNSANRMVVANDYEAACNRDSRVRDTVVWGGEDEFPKAPGHIWFTFLPEIEHTFSNDEYKTSFTRDFSEYEFNYLANEDDREAQYANRQAYYDHNYLPASAIRSRTYNADGTLLSPGIWDDVDPLRIPTLVFHNRHPIFCEFLYDIGILKYFISQDRADVHQEIFDIIYNAFFGNDAVYYESFKTEYFNASLVKRIDNKISDISGFRMRTKTRLVLNQKTIAAEQPNTAYRDIYIPLAVPYEKYFTDDGYLEYDKLPNIDTKNFIDYLGEGTGDIYTDWSAIQKDIDDNVTQADHKVIIAPIYANFEDEYRFSTHPDSRKAMLKFPIYPDNFKQTESGEFTFNNVQVYKRRFDTDHNDEQDLLPYNDLINGWTYDASKPNQIMIGSGVDIDFERDTLEIHSKGFCGFYYLFNSFSRDILIHLFVDGATSGLENVTQGDYSNLPGMSADAYYLYTYDDDYLYTTDDCYLYTEAEIDQDTSYIETTYTTPRSYLTSKDEMYIYTTDEYYLTTNGYAVTSESDENIYTGPIIREINTKMYEQSALKIDLFERNRYLDLNYPSKNFAVIKNVIPVLKSVNFHNIIE